MSVGSFTFRCGECNRLLGVSRSRVGQTIICPKCNTEQPVPNPDLLGAMGLQRYLRKRSEASRAAT